MNKNIDDKAVKLNEALSLLAEIKPELQCRIDGLMKTWPAQNVLTCLHRNKHLMERINRILERSHIG